MKVINSLKLKMGEGRSALQTSTFEEPLAIKVDGANNGVVLCYDTGNDIPLTFKGSDTVLGGDKVITLPTGIGYMALDIGPFVQTSGAYKGHIIVEGDSIDGTIGLIELI